MPPIINTFDPLSAASEAVGAFSDRKRANETEQKARDYQAARDGRRDMEADRSYGLEKGRADDSHAATLSSLQTAEQQRKIAAATEEYNSKLRPITLQMEELNVKKTRGEILGQSDERKLRGLQVAAARVDLEIKQKYGVKEAQAALATSQANASVAATRAQYAPQEAQAGLDSTRAGTAATQIGAAATGQRMGEEAQRFPYQLQTDQLDVTGKRLSNAGQELKNTFERSQTNDPASDPKLERDYTAQLTSYTSRVNAYNKRAAANQLQPGEKEPTPPVSPNDFSATLADSIDHVKQNPSDLAKMLQGVDAMAGLSPYQKRQAHLALAAAIKGVTQQMQSVPYGLDLRGGSKAGGPFQSVLNDAAARHGVPLSIARALMGDESSGNPNAVSSAGAVGLLQLMGPAAQEMGVTDRRDPVQNINGGLGYLAKQFKRFGRWDLALAAYNAGPEAVARHGMAALNLPGADPNYVTKILGGGR